MGRVSRQHDLWEALDEAGEEMAAAINDYFDAHPPYTATRVEQALREYVELLGPVVGEAAAFALRMRVEAYLTAADRQQRLIVSLSAQPNLDEADVKILAQGQVDIEMAQVALLDADETVKARLDKWRD
jgi:hypothetical protein